MKKKLLTLLTLALCVCSGAWAEAATIGLTQDYTESPTPSSDNKVWTSLSSETNHLTLTQQIGSKILNYGKGDKGDVICDGSTLASKNAYMGCWRTGDPGTTYDDQYVGFDLSISEGYALNISKINARALYISTTLTWKVQILNSSDVVLYESSELSITNKGTSPKVDVTVSTLSDEAKAKLTNISGTVKVRLFVKGGKTKYFGIDQLTIDAETVVDERTTYTLTTSASPVEGGTVTPETGEQVEGSDVVLTATPNTGYKFIKWTIDGTDATTNPYEITNITAAHTAVATFEALPKITFAKDDTDDAILGVLPTVDYAESGTTYTLPQAYFLTKPGYTLTGWNDGTTTYAVGGTTTITGDVTFTAVFSENEVAFGDAATTVTWPFATGNGAPTIKLEGNTGYYVWRTTINGTTIDVPMFIDTRNDAGVSGKRGKVDMQANRAQVNTGTVFNIPAIKGMTITVTYTNGTPEVSAMTFAGSNADAVDKSAKTLTYSYSGNESSINIIDQTGSLYPSAISVSYPLIPKVAPEAPTFPATTTIDGGSTVAISSDALTVYYQWSDTEKTLTTESTGWTEGASAAVPNEAGTKYLYAYASNGDALNSAVVGKAFTITKTATTTTTTTWDFTNWSAATKAGVLADDTNWNQTETESGGNDFLENGGRAYKNALASAELQYDGTAIAETEGLKFTANAYGMAVLFDFDHTNIGTYQGGSYIWLYSKTSTITIPNVPAGSTIEIGVESHKDSEARGVTLNNCTQTQGEATAKAYQVCKWTVNTTGDITITPSKGLHIYYITLTKAEPAVAFTPANAKSTYVTTKALDFSDVDGLKAYVATAASAGKVTLTEVGAVPAGTPLMLIGTAGTEYTVPVATSASAPATNLFRAGDGTTVFDGTTYDYILYTDGLFHPIGSGTVATTKAYLHCDSDPTAAGARSLAITFDDDVTTGVTEIVNSKLSNSKYFDLQGRRVAAPQKGLYIVNGKKVVLK